MVDATSSRVRLRDLTRLGRSRTGHGSQAGRRPARALRAAEWSPRPYGHRQRLAAAPQSGQLAPRTCDLMASPIP
jgi:ribosomal protein L19E